MQLHSKRVFYVRERQALYDVIDVQNFLQSSRCVSNEQLCLKTSLVAQTSKVSVYNAGDPGSIPGLGDPLEKEMASHSRTIAWKIPWTEEPGRLQSMGLQRVRHD